MIFGILFAIGLGVVSYLNLFVGLILSFSGNDWFGSMLVVFAGLAILTLVASFFARKKIMVTLVVDIVSLVCVLFEIIYLFMTGIATQSIAILMVLIAVFVLGVMSVLFAVLAKNKSRVQNITSLELSE